MEFEYKVTVIIPVYNAEKTLSRTMDSLFQQTIAQGAMEIILINDGSSDSSPQLCDEYAQNCFNVRVIHQKNKGVSAARNAGIRVARGKYLLYLDSDDTLAPESLESISRFFDAHYNEIDLVTYPLFYQYENGNITQHFRYKDLTRTGLYDLDRYPFICQSTTNVCVKNFFNGQPCFDTSLDLAEDQLYNTQVLAKTGKLGFVKEAKYIYYRTSNSASSQKKAPIFSYDAHITVYREFLKLGDLYQKIKKACYYLILYNMNWRIQSNIFLPYHLKNREYEEALHQQVDILNQIPNQVILSYPNMDQAYRWYLLSLKTVNRPFVCADANTLKILDSTGQLDSQTHVLIVIEQMETVPGGFYLIAYMKCFALAFTQEVPRLFVQFPGMQQQELSLFLSQSSCYWTKFETNRFFAFHLFIPNEHSGKVRFEMSLHGVTYPTRFFYMMKQKVHPDIGCRYLDGEIYGLLCQTDSLEIKKITDPDFVTEKCAFEKKLWKEHKKQWLARQVMRSCSHKRVWLYYDSRDSLNNGYYQFLHDIKKNDGIKRYYIYHAENFDMIQGKFSGRAKTALVKFGSIRHKRLMVAAEKLLVAFIDRGSYLPFDPNTYQYYADLFHYQVIYLQHGVMHAKLPNMYSKEKVWHVNQVVVSTRFERENLLNLGYREEDILTCGMPRLDRLNVAASVGRKRKLLFAPSWRCSLVKSVNGAQTSMEDFYSSTYYKEFSSFLKDEHLHRFLEENNLYLDVQTHPMFFCYRDCFLPTGSKRIQETQFANVADYIACITDFSSLMFDFIYLDKPVISYFPDQEEFRSGSHTYNDFYYPLENGFTLYCKDKTMVLETLQRLFDSGFTLPPKIAERAQNLYYSREAGHMESLYCTLIGGK